MLIARLIADPEEVYNSCDAIDNDIEQFNIASQPLESRSCPAYEELMVDGEDAGALMKLLESYFPSTDMLVTRGPILVPQVFVSDMDSTMIGQECIDELADYAGLKDRIAAITERAMQGELDFESALKERVALLEGLDESAIARCLDERIRPNPGAKALVSGLKATGARTVLVTGGFHHFADRVAEELGFDRVVGNRLEVQRGVLTGKLAGPVTDANTKARVLAEEVALAGAGATSLGIGDGANDIPMIEASNLGFAYRAKPKARAAANGRIESGDLANVLRLIGIES